MNIINGDNLEVLQSLNGQRFDLAELDGPYMAGLEDWDSLTEAEYIQHYADRLTALRPLLQPWGVVFTFGYPEGCAEIKSWAHRTETLYLRRWLTWYKQVTAHKGRKVENILLLMQNKPNARHFGKFLTRYRKSKGLTCQQLGQMIDGYPTGRIGKGLYETPGGKYLPPQDKFIKLSYALGFNPSPWWGVVDFTFEGLTDIDYIEKTYNETTEDLNDNGLKSKPVGLYLDLFKPVQLPFNTKKALILYGGSGNAAIAAEALGYEVTVIERDAERCKLIERRAKTLVKRWQEKLSQTSMFDIQADAQQAAFV